MKDKNHERHGIPRRTKDRQQMIEDGIKNTECLKLIGNRKLEIGNQEARPHAWHLTVHVLHTLLPSLN